MKRLLLPRWIRSKSRSTSRLTCTRLEDRITPALVPSFDPVTGLYRVELTDNDDTAFLRVEAGQVELSAVSDFAVIAFSQPAADVKSIAVVDPGLDKANQSVTFAGGSPFALADELSVSGVEQVTVAQAVQAGGKVTLENAESISVNAALSGGNIRLATIDRVGPGQNITIAAAVTSSTGKVAIDAGDDFILTVSGSIESATAGGIIEIAIDTGSLDVQGATADIQGKLIANNGVSISGGPEADTFNLVATTGAIVVITGGDPDTTPGDVLNFNANKAIVSNQGGKLTVPGAKPVFFSEIETVNILNPGGTLILGTDSDDLAIVRNNGGLVQFKLNAFPFQDVLGNKVVFAAGKKNDTLIVDLTGGPVVLSEGVSFDGELGNDLLRVLGAAISNSRYVPDATVTGSGRVTIDGLAIDFANLQPVDIVGGASFTFDPPGAADVLTVSQGKLFGDATKAAVVIAGTSGGVAFETVAVRDVSLLTINTTTLEVPGQDDSITISTLDAGPLVPTLKVITSLAPGVAADLVELVGSLDLPGALEITTDKVKISTASVSSGGAQSYTAAGFSLANDATFISTGNANILFDSPINGAFFAQVNTGGTTTFAKSVNVAKLVTDAAGTTQVGGNVTATGLIEFQDSVQVTADVVFAANTVTFAGTLDGAKSVQVQAVSTTFGGPVGGTTPLTKLVTDGAGTTQVGGNVTATGLIEFQDSVQVTADVVFAANTVTFAGTLDGAKSVQVQAVNTSFGGPVGGSTPLTKLVTDGAGTTQVGGNVTATGLIEFQDSVQVTADVVFAANTVTFAGTLDGAKSVQVQAVNTTFGGPVGGSTPLAKLVTDGAGTTQVGGNVTATGLIEFQDSVQVTADVVFAANTVTFAGTLDGAKSVQVQAVSTTFGGPVGGSTPLTKLVTDGAGTTQVGGNVTATGLIEFQDSVQVTADVVFAANTVTFAGTLDGAKSVQVQAVSTTFGGPVGGTTPLTKLVTDGAGTTQVGGNVTATGLIEFQDSVQVTADVVFAANTVTFAGTLDGAKSVAVQAVSTTFGGPVGGTTPLTKLVTDGAGTTQVGGNVTATGLIEFQDSVQVTADVVFAANTVTFAGTLDGAKSVQVQAVNTSFGGPVGGTTPLTKLVTDAAGTTQVGGNVTVTGLIEFQDSVQVTADVVFAANTVTFAGTLDGAKSVQVQAVSTTFGGPVGGTTPLAKLVTDGAGTTQLNGGGVTTSGDQIYDDAVVLGKNTSLVSQNGSVQFNNKLDAAVAGLSLEITANQDVIFNGDVGAKLPQLAQITVQNARDVLIAASGSMNVDGFLQVAGSGVTLIAGPANIGNGGIDLTTTEIQLAADLQSAGSVLFNPTVVGVTQTAGALTTDANLALLGRGTFLLDQPGNRVEGTLRINTQGGPVTLRVADSLTVDPAGIVTDGQDVTLNVGRNFTAIDAMSTFTVPLIDLGLGKFVMQPGLNLLLGTEQSETNFNAEIKAFQAFFGIPGGGNQQGDLFNIRPSQFTPIFVYGNQPVPPGIPAGFTVDRLFPLLKGLTVSGFAYDGQDGFYEIVGRQKLTFFSIESLVRLSFSAAAIDIVEPNDGSNKSQFGYNIRVAVTQAEVDLISGLDGGGLQQNPFVVSPARVDPRAPFTAPQIKFGLQPAGSSLPNLVIANGPSTGAIVSVVSGSGLLSGTPVLLDSLTIGKGIAAQFYPYAPTFTGGINLAVGQVNGKSYIVTGADLGGGPDVRIFEFRDGQPPEQAVVSVRGFFAYEETFRGGVRVALGDVNGDGFADLITVPGLGGGPRVRVFDGKELFVSGNILSIGDFFAYSPTFRGGVFVDAADYDGDQRADIVTGPGRGGSDHIRIFFGGDFSKTVSFLGGIAPPANPLLNNGVYREGVGGVAFTGSSTGAGRDLLVSSPRNAPLNIRYFVGTGNVPVNSKSFFDFTSVRPLQVDRTKISYGASVAGFGDDPTPVLPPDA